ncbi:hypothetical protein BJX64DRAFT_245258 [Aspergillus heterothallicus]
MYMLSIVGSMLPRSAGSLHRDTVLRAGRRLLIWTSVSLLSPRGAPVGGSVGVSPLWNVHFSQASSELFWWLDDASRFIELSYCELHPVLSLVNQAQP